MSHAVIPAFIVGQNAYKLEDVKRRNSAVPTCRHKISLAERELAILSRSKFFGLARINTSESTRRPDWIPMASMNKLYAFSLDGVAGAARQPYAEYI
eukprot:9467364-Pyramimonas_sp.AAC.1